ncbi:MAG: prohibitin family protein [candidate division Zixibacteria bacterium]|nr:prohibitin family protein [candidate division Zixibacteria bacterium]
MQGKKSVVMVLLLLVVFLMPLIFTGCGTQVDSGYRGVKYFKFGDGTEMGKIYTEGFNWHLPWNTIFTYSIKLQEAKENLKLLTSDGATIGLEVSIWYRPFVDKLDSLHITIGRRYFDIVVGPALRGEARSIVGRYRPEELYSTKRDEISIAILDAIRLQTQDKFVSVDNVIIRNVDLPARIKDAINEKLTMQQEAQRMEFVLQKEEQEAERKRIEAQGIADFQRIVSEGINQNLLRWKGIETTQNLAESPNTKIVIIGSGKDGLPLILGGN